MPTLPIGYALTNSVHGMSSTMESIRTEQNDTTITRRRTTMTRMTINGVSTTTRGQEKYERFSYGIGRRKKTAYQYDYRTEDGELFSCCRPTLEACREARNKWMNNH
jgi:hypothetical protein